MGSTTLNKTATIIVMASFAATITLASAGVQAAPVTPSDVNGVQHFTDCLGAMFNDPAEHALSCAPGNAGPMGSLSSQGGASVDPCSSEGGGPIWEMPTRVVLEPGMRIHVACGGADEQVLQMAPAT